MTVTNDTLIYNKYEILESHLQQQIKDILAQAQHEESIDYFKIEIANHNGKLQVDYLFRDRVTLY